MESEGTALGGLETFYQPEPRKLSSKARNRHPLPSRQGTVLGLLQFLAYINDMVECVTSKIRLFADDSLLYKKVQQSPDCLKLQQGLDRLQ